MKPAGEHDSPEWTHNQSHSLTTIEYGSMTLGTLVELHGRLSVRDAVARATAPLVTEGRYDSEQHPALDDPGVAPLSPGEHLELLAVDRAIADTVLRSRQVRVWRARQSAADWVGVAAALRLPVATIRAEFSAWIEQQAAARDGCLARGIEHPYGLDPATRAPARELADDPGAQT